MRLTVSFCLLALIGAGCGHSTAVPLEPEQTYVLPDDTFTASGAISATEKSESYPRALDTSRHVRPHANLWWGVTDRLTVSLPLPLSGAFLLSEGLRSQTIAQWSVAGGVSSLGFGAFTWSGGLMQLAMLGPNTHLIVAFGAGTSHDNLGESFLGDATVGAMLRIGERLKITPAVQGYRDWPLSGIDRLQLPPGSYGLRVGGVTDRGRLTRFGNQPLVMLHVYGGLSLFENTVLDFRFGTLYEVMHLAGVRWRF